jgi:hypothetical protein
MPEMQGMARPQGTRGREERLFLAVIVADVHGPWAVWVDGVADLGRNRLVAKTNLRLRGREPISFHRSICNLAFRGTTHVTKRWWRQ